MPDEEARLLEIATGILADLTPTATSGEVGAWKTFHDPIRSPSPGSLWESLGTRCRAPLVQVITNSVAMDLTANVLLASRCSPAMVSDASESAEFAAECASALLVNVGTLSPGALAGARAAAAAANAAGKRWVLDPVAMGGTAARSEAIVSLVRDLKPTVIKGNGSEMIALAKALGFASKAGAAAADDDAPRGVDCAPGVTSNAKAFAAASIARGCRCVAVVTGETDYIFWPPEAESIPTTFECYAVESGSARFQPAVTAQGCALGALIAALCGCVTGDSAAAGSFEVVARVATAAVAAFGAAAVIAEHSARGPGSFRASFIDSLWNLTAEEVDTLGRASARTAICPLGAAPSPAR